MVLQGISLMKQLKMVQPTNGAKDLLKQYSRISSNKHNKLLLHMEQQEHVEVLHRPYPLQFYLNTLLLKCNVSRVVLFSSYLELRFILPMLVPCLLWGLKLICSSITQTKSKTDNAMLLEYLNFHVLLVFFVHCQIKTHTCPTIIWTRQYANLSPPTSVNFPL